MSELIIVNDNDIRLMTLYKTAKDIIINLVSVFSDPKRYRALGYSLSSNNKNLEYGQSRIRKYTFKKKDNPSNKLSFIAEKAYPYKLMYENFSTCELYLTRVTLTISPSLLREKTLSFIQSEYPNDESILSKFRQHMLWYKGRNGVCILSWVIVTPSLYGDAPNCLSEYISHWLDIPEELSMHLFSFCDDDEKDISINHARNSGNDIKYNTQCYTKNLSLDNIVYFYQILGNLMR